MRKMNLAEITTLRAAVDAGAAVHWIGHDNVPRKIVRVPRTEMDPDKTGITDFVAFFADNTHIDLSDIDVSEFVYMKSMF